MNEVWKTPNDLVKGEKGLCQIHHCAYNLLVQFQMHLRRLSGSSELELPGGGSKILYTISFVCFVVFLWLDLVYLLW